MAAACRNFASWVPLVCLVVLSFVNNDNNHNVAHGFVIGTTKTTSRAFGVASSLKKATIEDSSTNDVAAAASNLPPVPKEWQGDVLNVLSQVIDPDLNRDIVTLGFVQELSLDGRDVSFDVELTTPACPVKDMFAQQCRDLVESLPWTCNVSVTMTAQSPNAVDTTSFSQIGAIVAISSCKGGVGKSTTAVNLAFALQSLGATVGILDADVYGPSLPTMIAPDDDVVRFVGRQIAPLQRNGIRLMSFGYVNDGSAVMRGPMVTQLLDQILTVTAWGKLDYLILDMPPGTGDIPLTLTQRLNITAAVIVTTPQELSFADVVRGIEMFDSVNVPCVAVVENMAFYEMEQKTATIDQDKLKQAMMDALESSDLLIPNGKDETTTTAMDSLAQDLVQVVTNQLSEEKISESSKIRIFGKGHKERLSRQWGIDHTFSVPLLETIAANGDAGTPFVLEYPDSKQAAIYRDLATSVVQEVAKTKFYGNKNAPSVEYDKERHVLKIVFENESLLKPAELRRACRCASCVEEMTGRQLLMPSDVPESVAPLKMYPTGNYALSVDWSDGHASLYPYKQIRAMLQDEEKQEQAQEKSNVEQMA